MVLPIQSGIMEWAMYCMLAVLRLSRPESTSEAECRHGLVHWTLGLQMLCHLLSSLNSMLPQ